MKKIPIILTILFLSFPVISYAEYYFVACTEGSIFKYSLSNEVVRNFKKGEHFVASRGLEDSGRLLVYSLNGDKLGFVSLKDGRWFETPKVQESMNIEVVCSSSQMKREQLEAIELERVDSEEARVEKEKREKKEREEAEAKRSEEKNIFQKPKSSIFPTERINREFISSALIGLLVILLSSIVGGLIIASGQVFLAIRETAINTRKGGEHYPYYNVLFTIAKVNNILGWIIIGVGILAGTYYCLGKLLAII